MSHAPDEVLLGFTRALRAAGVALHRGPNGPSGLPDAPGLRHEYGDLAATVEIVADVED